MMVDTMHRTDADLETAILLMVCVNVGSKGGKGEKGNKTSSGTNIQDHDPGKSLRQRSIRYPPYITLK